MIRCDYFESGVCRSCSEIRLGYGEQLRRKHEFARLTLATLGGQEAGSAWLAPVPSETAGFRNRAKMVVTGTAGAPRLGILGDEFEGVDLTACLLCARGIRESFPAIVRFIRLAKIPPYDVKARRGELKFVLVTVGENGGLMVRFVLRTDEAVVRIRKHLDSLLENLPQACVVSVNLQPRPSAIVEGDVEIVLTEQSSLPMSFGGHPLLLPPGAFFQTNSEVAARLYRLAAEWVGEFPPSNLLDLYCGVGGFALHAAEVLAGANPDGWRVRGLELHPDAVECANRSAALWGLPDVRFQIGDATALAQEETVGPDLVVVNPPRRGMGGDLCRILEKSDAGRLIYSSCNVESLVRDVRDLPSFRIERAVVLDMFPHTLHFETLVLLGRH